MQMAIHDLVIIGAGPAGLSLAQYAATRGYSTLVLDAAGRPGGRAATSPWLENVPGFPNGIHGTDFGERLMCQASRLGASVKLGSRVTRLDPGPEHISVRLADGDVVFGERVVIATGLTARKGRIEGAGKFTGTFLTYEPPAEYEAYAGKRVCVYGGGNAAGQVILALARMDGCRVEVLLPESTLMASMSPYLARRVRDAPSVRVRACARLDRLENVSAPRVRLTQQGRRERMVGIDHLFVLLGGDPDTEWLETAVQLDRLSHVAVSHRYETSTPGVYAIGDVTSRRGNTVMAAYGDAARVLAAIESRT